MFSYNFQTLASPGRILALKQNEKKYENEECVNGCPNGNVGVGTGFK